MVGVVVTCPECAKKFRPKADVQGKKIKCPFCAHPFRRAGGEGAKPDNGKKAKVAAAKSDKARPDAKPAPTAAEAAKSQLEQDLETDENPYGVKHMSNWCRAAPSNCTEEMENEHAVICLNCEATTP